MSAKELMGRIAASFKSSAAARPLPSDDSQESEKQNFYSYFWQSMHLAEQGLFLMVTLYMLTSLLAVLNEVAADRIWRLTIEFRDEFFRFRGGLLSAAAFVAGVGLVTSPLKASNLIRRAIVEPLLEQAHHFCALSSGVLMFFAAFYGYAEHKGARLPTFALGAYLSVMVFGISYLLLAFNELSSSRFQPSSLRVLTTKGAHRWLLERIGYLIVLLGIYLMWFSYRSFFELPGASNIPERPDLIPMAFTVDWAKASSVATVVTCLVVIWYTVETQKLRILSERQIELLVRPVVVARMEGENMYLRNLGQGVAFNIHLECSPLLDDVPKPTEYIIHFPEPVSALERGSEQWMRPFALADGRSTRAETLMYNLNPEHTHTPLILTITYDDADGVSYKAVTEIGPGTWKVAPPERLG